MELTVGFRLSPSSGREHFGSNPNWKMNFVDFELKNPDLELQNRTMKEIDLTWSRKSPASS
jgi:hypothetical protein